MHYVLNHTHTEIPANIYTSVVYLVANENSKRPKTHDTNLVVHVYRESVCDIYIGTGLMMHPKVHMCITHINQTNVRERNGAGPSRRISITIQYMCVQRPKDKGETEARYENVMCVHVALRMYRAKRELIFYCYCLC